MAPKLPRGFAAPQKVHGKGKEPASQARPTQKKQRAHRTNLPSPSPVETPILVEDTGETPPTKRPRVAEGASSLVEKLIGSAAAPLISENEIHAWRALEGEEEAQNLIRLSAQQLVHALGRVQAAKQEKTKRAKLESDNQRLAAMVVETDNRWKKDFDIQRADLSVIRADLQESIKHRDLLSEMVDKVTGERDELRARLDSMEKEKEAFGDQNFEKGFNFYLIGFLAHDPHYDWSRFGEGCVEDIKNFAIDNADAIKAKRVEVGLAEGIEDAPSPEGAPGAAPGQTAAEGASPALQNSPAPVPEELPSLCAP